MVTVSYVIKNLNLPLSSSWLQSHCCPLPSYTDLLGSVEVPLVSIPEEKLGLQVMEKQLPLTNGSGKISVHAELGWETNM